ncbi:hypothetical protein C4F49_06115 [Sphingobacterium sp. KB22]|uniref:Uncharacterized protein n=2 Tax=Sphingobacterium hungaricum TaxID=2082723 RepID=A0A928YQ57_9SPHI|nr:hypothetical protein [Sphingobacterium hungaricum]
MELTTFFANLFIYTFSIFAGILLTFKLLWPKIESYMLRTSSLNRSKAFLRENLQLTYTAYERLLLFTLRIEPYQLMLRMHNPNQSVSEFRQALIQEIENEYQHNFTQQLYVSSVAWHTINELKKNTISLLKNSSDGLPKEATLDNYISVVLKHMKELEPNPYEDAQKILKRELSI